MYPSGHVAMHWFVVFVGKGLSTKFLLHFIQVRFDMHYTQFVGQDWHDTILSLWTFIISNGQVNEHWLLGLSNTNIGFIKMHWSQTEFPLTNV